MDGIRIEQWLSLLLQELGREPSIKGLLVSASDISASMLWEFDMLIVAYEVIQEVASSILSCLFELAFHRAVIIFSLQHLCYKCFTGVWPIGVQDTVMVERNFKKSAYDLLFTRESTDIDNVPETMKTLLYLLDHNEKNTLQEMILARESRIASLEPFTDVQKRRALALKSILCRSHDYKLNSNIYPKLTIDTPACHAERNVMGPRVMLFSLITEIINYCNGTGSMSEDMVNINTIC